MAEATRRRTFRGFSGMLTLALLASRTADGQDAVPRMCSCSPTEITFALDLSGSCETNDLASNPGIEASLCVLEENASLHSPAAASVREPGNGPGGGTACSFCPSGLIDPAIVLPTNDGVTCGAAADYAATLKKEDDACATVGMAEELCCAAAETVAKGSNGSGDGPVRLLRRDDRTIVGVVSVQFFEFGTAGDLRVITQDDTYRDVSLTDGDEITFRSASRDLNTSMPLEEQLAQVPGGASLVLYGWTVSGEAARNEIYWKYSMGCGDGVPWEVGDEVGWVRVVETSDAWPAFCPPLPSTDSPTMTPQSNGSSISTAPPSQSPVSESPIKRPPAAPTATPAPVSTSTVSTSESPVKQLPAAPIATAAPESVSTVPPSESPINQQPATMTTLPAPTSTITVPPPSRSPIMPQQSNDGGGSGDRPMFAKSSKGKAAKDAKTGRPPKSEEAGPGGGETSKSGKGVKSGKAGPKGGKGSKSGKTEPKSDKGSKDGKAPKGIKSESSSEIQGNTGREPNRPVLNTLWKATRTIGIEEISNGVEGVVSYYIVIPLLVSLCAVMLTR